MISKNITIERDFNFELEETDNKFFINGYIHSDKDLKKHEVFAWVIMDSENKTFYEYPYPEEDNGSYYLGMIDKDRDITEKDILNMVNAII